MIDLFLGQIGRLIVLVVIAVAVVQQFEIIMSVLLAAGLMLVIARLLWPTPRR